jgi:hypothetical protein
MANKIRSKDQATTRAEQSFRSAERRDITSKQITEDERAITAAKTKRLRALRLAKETADLRASNVTPSGKRQS